MGHLYHPFPDQKTFWKRGWKDCEILRMGMSTTECGPEDGEEDYRV